MRSNRFALGLLVVASIWTGCASSDPGTAVLPEAKVAPPPEAPSCKRASKLEQKPLARSGSSSAIALARAGNRTIAYVADEDDRVVRTIDVDAMTQLASTPVDGAPSELLVLDDGRIAVSLRDKGSIEVLEPHDFQSALDHRCTASVATEPSALAAAPDGATIFTVSRWGHTLTALDAATFEPRFTVDLPRDPRGVVASSDGKKVFVSHVAGSIISVVDVDDVHAVRAIDLHDRQRVPVYHLEMGAVRDFHKGPVRIEKRDQRADQGFALVRTESGRILAPETMVDTGNGVRSVGYGDSVSAFADIATIDEKSEKRLQEASFGGLETDCILPRAAALDTVDDVLLVACLGLDSIVGYDAKSTSPHSKEKKRWAIGIGPTGVAVDSDAHVAVAWSQFEHQVTTIDLRRKKGVSTQELHIERSGATIAESVARGRILFHASGGRRFAFDGRACASCHPDGRDDGMTWTTPEGPRQTPMLATRLDGSAPYGWTGASKDLGEHIKKTLDRLAGTGLTQKEQDEVFAYIATLRAPEAAKPAADAIARGSEIFHGEEAGCSSCHLGDDTTDHASHDVKSRAAGDATSRFDTPSLKLVGESAPYYHDGRFKTLGELLLKADGSMGHTKQLTSADRDALEAYLKTL